MPLAGVLCRAYDGRMTDPRDARYANQLPDAAMWQLVCAPDVPAPELARRLGILPQRVRSLRHRLRQDGGWVCRVAYLPCRICGRMTTRGGHLQAAHITCATCRPDAQRHSQRVYDRRRWARLDAHRRNETLDRGHAYEQEHQTASLGTAVRRARRWTADEDTFIASLPHLTGPQLAEALGRTLYAVRARQVALRRRGLLEPARNKV
jgi:hypothetical protein